ncbi:transmembrane protein 248-like, partial [Stegodyphus dumicola]|uniref:transmembrane protein 248-like n=1 Tax=Stegodyphus dumicola TaxID=202533 RepID=UPI0015AFAAA6
MGYSVSQSLISGQPPLLVFTICLTAFGLSMVILAYVVGEQEVPNPDVQMDWNKFFKKISYLKLCTLQNDTRPTNDGGMQKKGGFKSITDSAWNSSNSHIVDKSISAVLSDVVDGATEDDLNKFTLVNIAVKVQFGLRGKLPSDSVYMKGGVNGKLLGFS